MFSLDGYEAVDLSPRIKARIYRADGSIEEGNTDPYGKPWVMQEGVFPLDNSLFTLYAAPKGDEVWHQERQTSHHGSHVQGGKGHISHWVGTSPDMKGLWEMPVETFMGEATVCNLADLEPRTSESATDYPKTDGWKAYNRPGDVVGQEILPDHLDHIEQGDIVLMTSPFKGMEQPWLSERTAQWLITAKKIKMLGLSATGIEWQYDQKAPAPLNSPVRRILLGNNVPIAHPLVNIETLTAPRVLYVGLPFNFTKFEASFVRAVAFQAPEESS